MRNVVVICLDTVRKDTFDAHAPLLADRVDTTYAHSRAASSWSVPSHASMLTGQLPHQHGVHTHARSFGRLDRAETFLGDLPNHRALGVSANVFAGSAFGFDRLFDDFADVSTSRRFPSGLDAGGYLDAEDGALRGALDFAHAAIEHDHPVAGVANGALGALYVASRRAPVPTLLDDGATAVVRACRHAVRDSSEPFVLFANVMDAHTPLGHTRGYDPSLHDAPNAFSTDELGVWDLMEHADEHREYLELRRGLYAAAVDYLDRTLAPFVDWVVGETDLATSVVVTADHGENLGSTTDEGLVRHKSSLSEGLLHVPLGVVNPPAGYPDRVPGLVSHLALRDLVAALADDRFADVTADRIPAEVIGMSAGPEPPDDRDRAYWDRAIRCAYDGESKYVWDSLGDRRRYDLDADRPNWQALAATDVAVPGWAAGLFDEDVETAKRRALAAGSDAAGAGADDRSDLGTGDGSEYGTDAAVVSRLRDLGYL